MTNKQMAAALEDLLNQWEKEEVLWVTVFGTTEGFSAWFTEQLMKEVERCTK